MGLVLAGAPHVAIAGELHDLHLEALDPVAALHLDRRPQEMQVQPSRGVVPRIPQCPVLERLDDRLDLVVGADRFLAGLVEFEALGVHDDLHIGLVVELAQLQRRELGLRRAAPGEQVHVGDLGVRQAPVHVLRDLGAQQVVGLLGQYPGDVQRNVAGADHRDLLAIQRPVPRRLRVAVVPVDEVRGAEAVR